MAKKEIVKVAIVGNSVLEELKKNASPLVKKLTDVRISTKSEYELVAKHAAQLKAYTKEAKELQAGIIDPQNLAIKNTKALFRPSLELWEHMELMAKNAMLLYLSESETKAKAIEAKFDKGDIKKVSTVTAKTSELRDTKSANSSVRKIWTLKILDEKKIPREFLVPDEVAIKTALNAGKKVPGCIMEQVNTIAI